LGGIASNGHLVRPHVVVPDQLPAEFRRAVLDTFSGSGEATVPLNSDTWITITDGMAAATTTGTASAAHLEGVDFAGKTGTAQVTGTGDTHVKGGAKTPNSWFVGMAPRRNPEIVIAVLQEHGDWGANSAKIAAQIVTTYVNKKRQQEHNVLDQASAAKPVEVGAVWSEPQVSGRKHGGSATQATSLHGGHFFITPSAVSAPQAVATGFLPLPAWLSASLLRFKEDLR
jgi:penicillin-binding protein 2